MWFLFHLTSILIAVSAQSQLSVGQWQFLVPGEYHSGEAPAKPGNGWLALVPVDGVWRLEPTTVRAKRVFDPVGDAEGEKTGIQISSGFKYVLALLRIEGIKSGKVDTPPMKFVNNPRDFRTTDPPLVIPFKGFDYIIHSSNSGIFLQKGEIKTELIGLSASSPENENSASLLWAGDIDGDGKLDLLFSYTGFNSGGCCIYLSSRANPGDLVKQVACHGYLGC